jgi:nitrate reductase gamma subunit
MKRMAKQQMRALSNPDDYISNLLVTVFQFVTALVLIDGSIIPSYFILASVLLLYVPLSKLKHTIYFFAARYHLGYFFGWRNVWPPKQTP